MPEPGKHVIQDEKRLVFILQQKGILQIRQENRIFQSFSRAHWIDTSSCSSLSCEMELVPFSPTRELRNDFLLGRLGYGTRSLWAYGPKP